MAARSTNTQTVTASLTSRKRGRRRRQPPQLCYLLAVMAVASPSAIMAFGPASPASKTAKSSSSALDSSTTIAIPSIPLMDSPPRIPFLEECFPRQKKRPLKILRWKNRSSKKATATATDGDTTTENNAASTPLTQSTGSRSDSLEHEGSNKALEWAGLDEGELLRRKREWIGRYTSVEALREHFGANENKLWGDLQASTARRLYKTLLPRSLLDLSQLGVHQSLSAEELAPLAYQARVAAKLYARERCRVPARIAATLWDGFRQYLKYGKFQAHGMTYEQVWQKYSDQLLASEPTPATRSTSSSQHSSTNQHEQVCLKILERSCVSNSRVDAIVKVRQEEFEVLAQKKKNNKKAHATAPNHINSEGGEDTDSQQQLLERIHGQLEQDMYQLLLPNITSDSLGRRPEKARQQEPWSKRNHVLMVRLLARQRRLEQRRQEAVMQRAAPSDAAEVLRP